ncbi:MAG TPA: NDP-sugar synthase [Terriglobales bacterium]|nr:NDP-sugar synthase [Terriglobales bacterium]
MKAMVLAAGQGMRLRPLTERRPKALVPVAGRAMIEYPLLLLRHYGIHDIVINLHHHGEQIVDYLGTGERYDLHITYSRERELLGTGGGLLKAKSFLKDETFIVINTDVLIDLSLADLMTFHQVRKAAATLVLRPDERADDYGSIEIDAKGRICRFLDTRISPSPGAAGRKLMFTGVQILEPEVFRSADYAAEKFSTTRHIYPHMLRQGEALYGYSFEGYWQDLGTEVRIRQAEEDMIQGKARLHFL